MQQQTFILIIGRKLSKNNLKVGEWVGFDRDGEQITGVVIRLNHKTVTLMSSQHHRWRVSFNHLFKIVDVEPIKPDQITQLSEKHFLAVMNNH